jgi:hypothetical protein
MQTFARSAASTLQEAATVQEQAVVSQAPCEVSTSWSVATSLCAGQSVPSTLSQARRNPCGATAWH